MSVIEHNFTYLPTVDAAWIARSGNNYDGVPIYDDAILIKLKAVGNSNLIKTTTAGRQKNVNMTAYVDIAYDVKLRDLIIFNNAKYVVNSVAKYDTTVLSHTELGLEYVDNVS